MQILILIVIKEYSLEALPLHLTCQEASVKGHEETKIKLGAGGMK
jgi:hypothetical protein